MAVVLRSPWQGHPAGATLSLSATDERQLVRGGAAYYAAVGLMSEAGPEAIQPLHRDVAGRLVAPVTKRPRGRPPKPKA